jgi:hypothetical protein
VVDGYAVGYHGYPRATGDLDVWVAVSPVNADRIVDALRDFGFAGAEVTPELFLKERSIVRMGFPPLKVEITTHIDGVAFARCHERRILATIDGVEVSFIGLDDLKLSKRASGRSKDLADLDTLP